MIKKVAKKMVDKIKKKKKNPLAATINPNNVKKYNTEKIKKRPKVMIEQIAPILMGRYKGEVVVAEILSKA